MRSWEYDRSRYVSFLEVVMNTKYNNYKHVANYLIRQSSVYKFLGFSRIFVHRSLPCLSIDLLLHVLQQRSNTDIGHGTTQHPGGVDIAPSCNSCHFE